MGAQKRNSKMIAYNWVQQPSFQRAAFDNWDDPLCVHCCEELSREENRVLCLYCQCISYCSEECRAQDWRDGHQFVCRSCVYGRDDFTRAQKVTLTAKIISESWPMKT